MAQVYGNKGLSSYEWNIICRVDKNIVPSDVSSFCDRVLRIQLESNVKAFFLNVKAKSAHS